MTQASDLLAVVSRIYETSVDSAGLSGLAGIVAEALDAPSGFIGFLTRPEEGEMGTPAIASIPSATENFDEWARSAYAQHYHQCNVWLQTGIKKGFPAIVLGHELIPTKLLIQSEWYEYCQKLDAFHVLGAQFHLDRRLSGMFGAHRPRSSKAFDESSRRKMSLLLPHLQRALQIQGRLGLSEQVRNVTQELLERLGFGVLILDRTRRLLFANGMAKQLLDEQSALRFSNGRVSACFRAEARFNHMVDDAGRISAGEGLSAGGMLNLTMEDDRSVRLLIAPLSRHHMAFDGDAPAILVLIIHPNEVPAPPADAWRKVYGLTPAEARLLAALIAGERLSRYADRLKITIGTARTHMKHLLGKTGFHRQVDLVRTLASDPLSRVAPGPSCHASRLGRLV